MPNSLSLALTESALFLRAVHVHRTPSSHDNAPPAILRGLLVLSLAKPTRISSIQVELVAQSVTIWTEGMVILSTFLRYIR
jgi:arrestin-related trafficking adapter 3/6